MIRCFVMGCLFGLWCMGLAARAADISMLQATEFLPSIDSPTVPKAAKVVTNDTEINLSMDLDSLVANADGPKTEDSASMQGDMIVEQPGFVSLPVMVITVSGHIIKTAHSTARIDLQVGAASRRFFWGSDDVQSGRYSFTITETVADGKVPPLFPVTVLAFVTKDPGDGAVLVSLEKIQVKLGNFAAVALH